ncbi:MAG: hypothetical protein ABSC73_09505, partial [Acidimicrobiales bacterium]
MNRWVAPVLWLLLAMPLLGSGKKRTQAEVMGFAGPVKSVSTTQQAFLQQPAQPDGFAIIFPLFCGECEFDRDGNQVRSGWMGNGQFSGNAKRETRDGLGRVQEEIWENEKGELMSRHVYANGPEGRTQDDSYVDGKLFKTTTFAYDSRGNIIEADVYNPDGTLESRHRSTFDERGNEIESVSEGPGDIYYDVVETYNPRTGHLESFTSLNRDGSMRLWLRLNDDTVLSYWQQPGDGRTYGSGICFGDDDAAERDCREYNWDGTYTTTHYTFTDKTKRNPAKVILYDAEHQAVMEADYEYELDAFGNWTKRTVWVQTRESGERQLLEKDART